MSLNPYSLVGRKGFNAINATELPTALATNLTYYQVNTLRFCSGIRELNPIKLWNSSHFEMNYGDNGLKRLDYVVEAAERVGIKLIIAFTNNWFVSIYLDHEASTDTITMKVCLWGTYFAAAALSIPTNTSI